MLDDGRDIDFADSGLEVVRRESGTYVRSRPNHTTDDNLGTMASAVMAEQAELVEIATQIQEQEKTNPGIMSRLRKLLGF